jgi:hypothetical protein
MFKNSRSERKSCLPNVLTGVFIVFLTIALYFLLRSMVAHHFFSGGH